MIGKSGDHLRLRAKGKAGETMRIVDAHQHLLIGKEHEASYDPELLMNSGVVNQSWLLSANGFTGGHATDEEVLALCRRHPDAFLPFGYLDFRKGPQRIEYLRGAGCVGLKAIWPEEPYDAKRYFPLYECAEALRMPILFHVGGAYYEPPCRPRTADSSVLSPEQLYGRNMMPIHMDAIAKSFPKLVIIMAHLGGDAAHFQEAALVCNGHAGMKGRAMMYLDLSSELSYYGLPSLVKAKEVIDYVGPGRILYGSDAYYPYAVEVARFWLFFLQKVMRMREQDVARIMGGNADEIVREAMPSRGGQ